MNFTVGIIAAVGVLVAISLVFIAIDPGYIIEPKVKPVACTLEYAPVCGVDGITYGNSCMLNAAKIESAHTGECVIEKPLKEGWTRITSATDPGVGHESHQLALILPPTDKVYSGTLHYNATETVQLVTLHGPLKEGDEKGQAVWTADGVTKYALTIVNLNNTSGDWKFSGNALAIHTKKTTPFTVDYMVDYTENPISDIVKTGTIQSVQDPGIGHEGHQLAIILPPSSDAYSGIVSYSASEPIQLVALKGPIGPDDHPAKTWSVDGTTVYELIFVDPANSMGSWEFSGNALGIHTKNNATFTVSYSVSATTEGMVSHPPIGAMPIAPKTVNVSIPKGVSSPGCETTSTCFSPDSIEIQVDDTVMWKNEDTAAHTVTSGKDAAPDGIFDSSLFMSGNTFEFTFDKAGTYPYFCMVHPWMSGEIIVHEKFNELHNIAVGEPNPSAPVESPPVVDTTPSVEPTPTPVPEPTPAPTPAPIPEPKPTERRSGPLEVTIAQGASSPGCETTNECFLPYQAEINSGETIVWSNADSAAHTVTSGKNATSDGVFDSGMLAPKNTWQFTFVNSGEYDYYCMLHPWMAGKVIVQ